MTKNFLMTCASEPNISINQKLILKKKFGIHEMYCCKNLNAGNL